MKSKKWTPDSLNPRMEGIEGRDGEWRVWVGPRWLETREQWNLAHAVQGKVRLLEANGTHDERIKAVAEVEARINGHEPDAKEHDGEQRKLAITVNFEHGEEHTLATNLVLLSEPETWIEDVKVAVDAENLPTVQEVANAVLGAYGYQPEQSGEREIARELDDQAEYARCLAERYVGDSTRGYEDKIRSRVLRFVWGELPEENRNATIRIEGARIEVALGPASAT